MADKKTAKIDVHVSDDDKLSLLRLAESQGVTLSEDAYDLFAAHLDEKRRLRDTLNHALPQGQSASSSGGRS